MRMLVFGAGVLGSLYAARLKQAGHDVTILARGQRAAEIRTHGVVLEEEATGKRTITALPVVTELAPDEAYDLILVLVLVRKDQLPAALPVLATNSATPSVLFMVNNAAGPDELIRALGPERVLLGFPGAGGAREGHVVRCQVVSGRLQATTVGELDGRVTPRLVAVAEALRTAGFPTVISHHIDAWLKTHVALLSALAAALYYAGDNYHLAGNPEGLRLLVAAMREGFRVLNALSIPVTPARYKYLLSWLPTPLLVWLLRRGLNTRRAELLLMRHADAARGEMKQLANEFMLLVHLSGIPTPALDLLYPYTASMQAAG